MRSATSPRRTRRAPGAKSIATAAAALAILTAGSTAGLGQDEGAGAGRPATTVLRVEPELVTVDLLYNGAMLDVRGPIAAGHEAAVVCVGKAGELELKRKGRVWGVLWMNTADVAFEGVPSVYLVSTSTPLDRLGPPEALADAGIGYDSLRAAAAVKAPPEVAPAAFGELVQLKEREGLFCVNESGVRISSDGAGGAQLHARLFLPARVVPGDYEVRAYAFADGAARLLGSQTVHLRQGGMAAFISTTASAHGLVFGIASVLVAMAAGLLTGLAFGAGGKRGH
jgi:uncharacterized protein (TIGR02186 family)